MYADQVVQEFFDLNNHRGDLVSSILEHTTLDNKN